MMMRRQLELRREETAALHASVEWMWKYLTTLTLAFVCRKCDTLEARLADLRASMRPFGEGVKSDGQDTVMDTMKKASCPVTVALLSYNNRFYSE
jgi:hypothetical protein